jgi:hypothetical protein
MGSLFPIYFSISRFADTLINNLRKGIQIFIHVAHLIARYIYKYLRLAYEWLRRFYQQFQKDPLTTTQFLGSMAILIASALL